MIIEQPIETIIRYIGWIRSTVELRNHINLYDINIHLEYLLSDLLNLMYDELAAFFEAKISEDGMAFDLMAIYFYLIHQTINCNVFPNPITS